MPRLRPCAHPVPPHLVWVRPEVDPVLLLLGPAHTSIQQQQHQQQLVPPHAHVDFVPPKARRRDGPCGACSPRHVSASARPTTTTTHRHSLLHPPPKPAIQVAMALLGGHDGVEGPGLAEAPASPQPHGRQVLHHGRPPSAATHPIPCPRVDHSLDHVPQRIPRGRIAAEERRRRLRGRLLAPGQPALAAKTGSGSATPSPGRCLCLGVSSWQRQGLSGVRQGASSPSSPTLPGGCPCRTGQRAAPWARLLRGSGWNPRGARVMPGAACRAPAGAATRSCHRWGGAPAMALRPPRGHSRSGVC